MTTAISFTPVPEPTVEGFKQAVKLSGRPPTKRFTKKDERMLLNLIKKDRAKKRHRT